MEVVQNVNLATDVGRQKSKGINYGGKDGVADSESIPGKIFY